MEPFSSGFSRWRPLERLGAAYDVDEISWGTGGISFTLISEDKGRTAEEPRRFRLTWDASHIISYHVTDETYRADCWGLDFKRDGRFYTSRESEYMEQVRQKSPLFPDRAIHFVIVGTNAIVDILAKEYPAVKIVE